MGGNMNRWSEALERHAGYLERAYRERTDAMAARLRAVLAFGVESEREATIALLALGHGSDEVEEILWEEPETEVPEEDTFLGMTCVAQGSSGPATTPRDVVLVGRCAGRTASEHVATWPDYLHSDDVKRRSEAFAKRCERLGVEPPGYTTKVVRFVETPDPDTGAPLYHVEPSTPHRYVGEFGDIDEPSVGDVEGYGVRR